jgi:hypothetical protein
MLSDKMEKIRCIKLQILPELVVSKRQKQRTRILALCQIDTFHYFLQMPQLRCVATKDTIVLYNYTFPKAFVCFHDIQSTNASTAVRLFNPRLHV